MENLLADLDGQVCKVTPQQLEQLRAGYSQRLKDLQKYVADTRPSWQQLDQLADQLKTELDNLQAFMTLSN